ncbi:MAG: hypothetical protein ACI3X4_02065 [Bacteroidaceae bacterium]
MEVINLHGTEDRLYELVARLVMNPDIIRQNNNYPFKTTPQHTWHICMCEGEVVGFMPVKDTPGGLYIDNYYVNNDKHEILEALISHILSATNKPVTALCHKRHANVFRQYGFISCTIFAQYNKMRRAAGEGDKSQ